MTVSSSMILTERVDNPQSLGVLDKFPGIGIIMGASSLSLTPEEFLQWVLADPLAKEWLHTRHSKKIVNKLHKWFGWELKSYHTHPTSKKVNSHQWFEDQAWLQDWGASSSSHPWRTRDESSQMLPTHLKTPGSPPQATVGNRLMIITVSGKTMNNILSIGNLQLSGMAAWTLSVCEYHRCSCSH